MASIKTSTSVSVSAGSAGAKKPSSGPGPGASASQVSANVPPAPKLPKSAAPKAPAAPKTPIAKAAQDPTKPAAKSAAPAPAAQAQGSTIDYTKMNAPAQKPAANTLNYAEMNKINQKPAGPALDYGKINAKPAQPEPNVLDYKSMSTPKPWAGSVDKANQVNQKIDRDMNASALDSLKARRMLRAQYLKEPAMTKGENTPPPPPPPTSQPPLAGAGSQDNVSKFKAGMQNQPGVIDTLASVFKDEVSEVADKSKKDAKQADRKAQADSEKRDVNGEFAKSLKGLSDMSKKAKPLSKAERDFIREDLGRPYVPYFNDIDSLVKKEFAPLEQEIMLDIAIRFEKGEIGSSGEALSKSDPLDKYKIDKGGSLKFGTHVKDVGFPRNTLESKENRKAGSDEGSGGEIKKFAMNPTAPKPAAGGAGGKPPLPPKAIAPAPAPAAPKPKMPKMTKAEIEAECKEDFKPRFRKSDEDVDKKLGVKDTPERQAKVKEMAGGLKAVHDKLSGNPVFNKKIRPNND